MLYVALMSVAMGFVLGLARGGRLSRLLSLRVRAPWIPIVAVAAQYALLAIPMGEHAETLVGTAHVLTYALLLLGIVLNRQLPGMPLIGLGILMNAVVIGANAGAMPVSPTALGTIGASQAVEHLQAAGRRHKSVLMTEQTPLPFLADWLPVPPIRTVISPGDVVIGLGGLLLVARGMILSKAASTPRG